MANVLKASFILLCNTESIPLPGLARPEINFIVNQLAKTIFSCLRNGGNTENLGKFNWNVVTFIVLTVHCANWGLIFLLNEEKKHVKRWGYHIRW